MIWELLAGIQSEPFISQLHQLLQPLALAEPFKPQSESCPQVHSQPPVDPVREVLGEVLQEVERVQWMLRLSPRLRQLHGD